MAPLMTEKRFWKKVDKQGPDECWEWKGWRHEQGYGSVGIDKRQVRTHRLAYELTNGPIPEGLFVCHSCDNPPCCNPAHLFLGTVQDNADDRMAKGRGVPPIGSKHGNAKLDEEKVIYIMARLLCGERQQSVADAFGVCSANIGHIWQMRGWKHVWVD